MVLFGIFRYDWLQPEEPYRYTDVPVMLPTSPSSQVQGKLYYRHLKIGSWYFDNGFSKLLKKFFCEAPEFMPLFFPRYYKNVDTNTDQSCFSTYFHIEMKLATHLNCRCTWHKFKGTQLKDSREVSLSWKFLYVGIFHIQ